VQEREREFVCMGERVCARVCVPVILRFCVSRVCISVCLCDIVCACVREREREREKESERIGKRTLVVSHTMMVSRLLECSWLNVLQCVAVSCRMLQCVAVCCSVLQCVAVCCSVFSVVHCGLMWSVMAQGGRMWCRVL